MLFILALVCFVLAVMIGSWRQSCVIYEVRLPYNLPRYWSYSYIRILTWLITAALSIIYSFLIASWVIENIGELIGKFSFGVLLLIRWITSNFFGARKAMAVCDQALDDDSFR